MTKSDLVLYSIAVTAAFHSEFSIYWLLELVWEYEVGYLRFIDYVHLEFKVNFSSWTAIKT